MKKRILALLLVGIMAFALVGCSSNPDDDSTTPPENGNGDSNDDSQGGDELLPLEADVFSDGKIALTSVGQSNDFSIVENFLGRIGIDTVYTKDLLNENDIAGYDILILAVGGSSKGLGAAGIDENEEIDRIQKLITAAQNNDVKILSMHIGGDARRGQLSDKFIPDAMAAADAAIVVSGGDTDNMIRDILIENSIPAEYVEKQIDSLEPLKVLFGK